MDGRGDRATVEKGIADAGGRVILTSIVLGLRVWRGVLSGLLRLRRGEGAG